MGSDLFAPILQSTGVIISEKTCKSLYTTYVWQESLDSFSKTAELHQGFSRKFPINIAATWAVSCSNPSCN